MTCRIAALCTLLLLVACNKHDDTLPRPKLLEQQREVLDKAKAVDSELQRQSEAQRKAVEQQAK